VIESSVTLVFQLSHHKRTLIHTSSDVLIIVSITTKETRYFVLCFVLSSPSTVLKFDHITPWKSELDRVKQSTSSHRSWATTSVANALYCDRNCNCNIHATYQYNNFPCTTYPLFLSIPTHISACLMKTPTGHPNLYLTTGHRQQSITSSRWVSLPVIA
jgi:hypothetical protein